MTGDEVGAGAQAALAGGRWAAARAGFEASLARGETAEACFGLAIALWWLGENQSSVDWCARAYALLRKSGEAERAAQAAVWLAITYKANFANYAAANGWLTRAERLLEPLAPGPLHGWVWVARAYRMTDLDGAEMLTHRALEVARSAGDVDLELVALSQLGLTRVGKGQTEAGFALIDEAMAATLAGEGSTLDTVVYTCCDMLNACEVATDIERAAQWCSVADDFVATYGCPFLYAECRIYYGSVLTSTGRWEAAERELTAGLRITDNGACPGLNARALIRMAGLRVRQGRLEEADQLLSHGGPFVDNEAEEALTTAALLLARGDAAAACRKLEERMRRFQEHRWHLASALDLLIDGHIAAECADLAEATAFRLIAVTDTADNRRLKAMAASGRGRAAAARGDSTEAVAALEKALELWSAMESPFETARAHVELAGVLAPTHPDAAVQHSRRALSMFSSLGASLDADRAAAFLRAQGAPARTGPKGVGVLTLREQEVLRLLGAGLSNPEIAGRLHISRKTAAHHVSNVLAKLGLRNRAEAAAYAAGGTASTASSGPRLH